MLPPPWPYPCIVTTRSLQNDSWNHKTAYAISSYPRLQIPWLYPFYLHHRLGRWHTRAFTPTMWNPPRRAQYSNESALVEQSEREGSCEGVKGCSYAGALLYYYYIRVYADSMRNILTRAYLLTYLLTYLFTYLLTTLLTTTMMIRHR